MGGVRGSTANTPGTPPKPTTPRAGSRRSEPTDRSKKTPAVPTPATESDKATADENKFTGAADDPRWNKPGHMVEDANTHKFVSHNRPGTTPEINPKYRNCFSICGTCK